MAAAAEAVFVVTIAEWLLYVGAFVLGVAAQGSKICVDTIVQTSVDDAYRGRVFSFYDVIFNIAFVAAAAFGAAVAAQRRQLARRSYAVIAAGYAVTAVAYARPPGARLHRRRTDARASYPRVHAHQIAQRGQGWARWVAHQARSSASAASRASGPCSIRTSLRCCPGPAHHRARRHAEHAP